MTTRLQITRHATDRYIERVWRERWHRSQITAHVVAIVRREIMANIQHATTVPIEAYQLFQTHQGFTRAERIIHTENQFYILRGNVLVTIVVFDEPMMELYEEISERAAA